MNKKGTIKQRLAEIDKGKDTPKARNAIEKVMAMFTKNKPKKMNMGGMLKKPEMAYGGSVGGKKHMYAGGGSVTDNAGLRALKKASPMAYNKIKG